MDIRAFAIDMDGTLLNDDKTISSTNLAMVKTIATSYDVILSSARGMGSLRYYIDELGLHGQNQYTVAYNGGYIIDGNGTLIDDHPIFPTTVYALLQWFNQVTNVLELNVYTCDRIIPYTELLDPSTFLSSHPIYKIGAIGEKSEVDRVRALIPTTFTDALAITSDKVSIECVAKGLSKAKGLSLVLDRLGLKPEQLVAIGDAENDIEMLDFAGYGIAMGNGDPKLFDHADYISADNNKDGVAKAIQHVLDRMKND